MDIKSKNSRAFIVWLCFFTGLSIIILLSYSGIYLLSDDYTGVLESIKEAFKEDIKETRNFQHTMTIKFDSLVKAVTDEKYLIKEYLPIEGSPTNYHKIDVGIMEDVRPTDYTGYIMSELEIIERGLNREGENLIYYAENLKTGVKLTNSKTDLGVLERGYPTMPQGYDYYFCFNGQRFIAENAGEKLELYNKDIFGYSNLWNWGYFAENINDKIPEFDECRIFFVVKTDLLNNGGSLYQLKRHMKITKWGFVGIITIFLSGLILIIISIINRKLKQEFDKQIVKFLGIFWFELKALISVFTFRFILIVENNTSRLIQSDMMKFGFLLAIVGWWLYLVFLDLKINKKKFFTNNFINAIIRKYHAYESKKLFQKGMLLRLYVLIGAEIILVFLACILSIAFFLATYTANKVGIYLFSFLIVFAIGIYLIYRYVRRYNATVMDIGKFVDQVKAIKSGEITGELIIDPNADMHNAARDLNKIQEGMARAVEEKIKSERTKIELITNVSHDLKTPLTSIISYVDLLSKEEGLPGHINDYIKVLQQKSDRLKTLIEDLFDLAKATSGEINIDYEKLDLGKLVQQTLADLDEEILQSGLGFKVNIPEQPIFIMSDGKKLYRIFLNLISNALKYSLLGSRVYIDLVIGSNNDVVSNDIDNENNTVKVTATIKNIANYEMNFNKDEILERFVRGDEARSSEGSGLGLAIAQSFTYACGGEFDIIIDGDMFKVKLIFDTID